MSAQFDEFLSILGPHLDLVSCLNVAFHRQPVSVNAYWKEGLIAQSAGCPCDHVYLRIVGQRSDVPGPPRGIGGWSVNCEDGFLGVDIELVESFLLPELLGQDFSAMVPSLLHNLGCERRKRCG